MIKEQEEQKIYKEFEKLGYRIIYNNDDLLEFEHVKFLNNIEINKEHKWYGNSSENIIQLDMKEHQLLHKLFELWGWFE